MQKKYCSGMGKVMHAMQYSKPETYNAVQDLSRHMHEATQDHYKAMLYVLKYSLDYGDQGLVIKPNRKWDSSLSHEFVISGHLDSDFVKESDAVSWDPWCILKGHQQCSRVVQKGQCHFPLPRQRHMQVLCVFKTYSIWKMYWSHSDSGSSSPWS